MCAECHGAVTAHRRAHAEAAAAQRRRLIKPSLKPPDHPELPTCPTTSSDSIIGMQMDVRMERKAMPQVQLDHANVTFPHGPAVPMGRPASAALHANSLVTTPDQLHIQRPPCCKQQDQAIGMRPRLRLQAGH